MTTLTPVAADNRRIDQQHAELGRLVAEITRVFDRGGSLKEIAPRLAELRVALAQHFATEERADGFYDQIVEVDPRFFQQVADLRDEHAVIRMLADDAVAAQDAAEANRAFTRLCELLQRHEHDENGLLQAAYCEDIGSKD